MQFHYSCKISVEFMSKFLCLRFGNVKIILNNPNSTSSLRLLPGKDVYFNVSILTLFVFIFIEYLYSVWLRFRYNFDNRDLKHRQRNGTTTTGKSKIFPRERSAHVRCCQNVVQPSSTTEFARFFVLVKT